MVGMISSEIEVILLASNILLELNKINQTGITIIELYIYGSRGGIPEVLSKKGYKGEEKRIQYEKRKEFSIATISARKYNSGIIKFFFLFSTGF
jgi:hypothetical protein